MNKLKGLFGSSKPDDDQHYNGYETPTYTVEKACEDYEIRCYEETKWVESKEIDDSTKKDSDFWSLYDYIRGANEEGTKVAMTVPITNEFDDGGKKASMRFFIPRQFSEKIPNPTNPKLHIRPMGKVKMYARRFGGFASDHSKIEREVLALRESLEKDNLQDTYSKESYILAVYQSPFKLMGRRNEILFVLND